MGLKVPVAPSRLFAVILLVPHDTTQPREIKPTLPELARDQSIWVQKVQGKEPADWLGELHAKLMSCNWKKRRFILSFTHPTHPKAAQTETLSHWHPMKPSNNRLITTTQSLLLLGTTCPGSLLLWPLSIQPAGQARQASSPARAPQGPPPPHTPAPP